MNAIEIIRALLPLAKVLAARTATPIDDAIIRAIELFLSAIPAGATKADVAAALRATADATEV